MKTTTKSQISTFCNSLRAILVIAYSIFITLLIFIIYKTYKLEKADLYNSKIKICESANITYNDEITVLDLGEGQTVIKCNEDIIYIPAYGSTTDALIKDLSSRQSSRQLRSTIALFGIPACTYFFISFWITLNKLNHFLLKKAYQEEKKLKKQAKPKEQKEKNTEITQSEEISKNIQNIKHHEEQKKKKISIAQSKNQVKAQQANYDLAFDVLSSFDRYF